MLILNANMFCLSKRVCQVMNAPIDSSSINLHWVRTVAPKKDMYCLSFQLPPEIAYAK
jgi:tRNA (guanine37-N1)-methyltransferase